MYSVKVNDFSQWRRQARELLAREVSPDAVSWEAEKQSSLLAGMAENFLSLRVTVPNPTVPRDFIALAKSVACYRDENRWSLLYRVAWRLLFEDKSLLGNKIDKQIARLFSMRKSVGRDKHKMEAFVRFRLVNSLKTNDCPIPISSKRAKVEPQASDENHEEYFVSWFEPEHLILPLVAPFFIKRFHSMNWSILTPDSSMHWNGEQILFTNGVPRPANIEDEVEGLWLEYYANIFNPARLKLKAMQSEMPKKYWVNLPEAPLISQLARSARIRTDTMIDGAVMGNLDE